jgi:hypothetical protein
MAVCGSVGGGLSTLLNRISTSLGERNAGIPFHTVFDVLGNCCV